MSDDPPRRPDGICALPGCGKPVPVPKSHHSSIDPVVYVEEPFCSSACCRAWYDNPLPKPQHSMHYARRT